MKNTGTGIWGGSHYLAGLNDSFGNWTGVGQGVAPGLTKTFTFNVTAPTSPGSYNFQFRMVEESIEWFGDVSSNLAITVGAAPTPTPKDAAPNSAQLISSAVPSNMITGQTYQVSLTLKNSGTQTWTGDYYLASRNSAFGNWVGLGGAVAPGGEKTFSFYVTAPSSPGSYSFDFQMVQEWVEWFGDPVLRSISVTP
jgi:hypothetical protein